MKISHDLKIPRLGLTSPLDAAKEMLKAQIKEHETGGDKPCATKITEALPAAHAKEILAIVINVWRIKSRMTDLLSKEPKEELDQGDVKKIARYLESIHNSFSLLGIEIIDRTGESFDYGLPEKVVAATPQKGISKELVRETLRPTVKWNNHIYPGEVEIATPITKNNKGVS